MSPITVFIAPFREGAPHSHELLRTAAAHLTGQETSCIARGQWGKPYFPDVPQLHFSISHSGEYWLCAFFDRPVGIDIQRHGSFVPPEKLSRRFFHPREDAFLAQGGYERFYDVWTAKESFVKFLGKGFYDEPETFSVVGEGDMFPSVHGAQLQHIPFQNGYSVCVCSEEIGEIVLRELI